jgi:hypothetical protein
MGISPAGAVPTLGTVTLSGVVVELLSKVPDAVEQDVSDRSVASSPTATTLRDRTAGNIAVIRSLYITKRATY